MIDKFQINFENLVLCMNVKEDFLFVGARCISVINWKTGEKISEFPQPVCRAITYVGGSYLLASFEEKQ